MNVGKLVGTIAAVWRFPVKSMQGEQVDGADMTVAGLVGDRAYALLDGQTGKVASATHPKLWPELIACRATFVESPRPGRQLPPIRIELADGTTVRSDAADVDAVLSRFFGRPVELARAAPKDFTIDQYHPDVENLDPEGHRDELTEQKLGAALLDELGMSWPLAEGSFLDLAPVSVITTSTLDQLGALQPDCSFDVRRFRMNVIVNTTEPGFIENDWVDRTLHLGDEVRLSVAMLDPRCVMTTVAQPGLPQDPTILKSLVKHNRQDVAGWGLYPCAGVYATVALPGKIRKGAPVMAV
jgi:MOSC domain-containing protein